MTAPVSEERLKELRDDWSNNVAASRSHDLDTTYAEQMAAICTELLAARRENDSLLRKFAEVERDAARYRWLRHGDHDEIVLRVYEPGTGGHHRPFDWRLDGVWLLRNEQLDAAIDSAMPGEQNKDSIK